MDKSKQPNGKQKKIDEFFLGYITVDGKKKLIKIPNPNIRGMYLPHLLDYDFNEILTLARAFFEKLFKGQKDSEAKVKQQMAGFAQIVIHYPECKQYLFVGDGSVFDANYLVSTSRLPEGGTSSRNVSITKQHADLSGGPAQSKGSRKVLDKLNPLAPMCATEIIHLATQMHMNTENMYCPLAISLRNWPKGENSSVKDKCEKGQPLSMEERTKVLKMILDDDTSLARLQAKMFWNSENPNLSCCLMPADMGHFSTSSHDNTIGPKTLVVYNKSQFAFWENHAHRPDILAGAGFCAAPKDNCSNTARIRHVSPNPWMYRHLDLDGYEE